MSAADFHSLSRVCVDGVCHCDWRLTIKDCVESKAMTIINIINIAISGVAIITSIGLLGHRVIIKGHRLFDSNLSKGCFRPKPIDCMLLFIVFFNILRLISSTVLVADICPDMISRSFIFEFPWQFGLGAFALYLIGIAQTLADSHKVLANSWLPSPKMVDFIGCTIFFSPFIINNCMSLTAGILAERNLPLAEIFVQLLYIFWFFHCSSLSITVFYSGFRLIRILQGHIKKFNPTGQRYVSLRTGIFKIRAVMSIITICLMIFAVFLLVFGILRKMILVNTLGSVILGAIWHFLGGIATFFVLSAILFNPKVGDSNNLGLKSSSAEKSGQAGSQFVTYSNFSTQEYSATNSNSATQGTLSNNAFDDLKLQQLQYQKLFQKHNQYQLPHNGKNSMGDLSTAESRQVKLTAAGIPVEDDLFEEQKSFPHSKTYPFPINHHQPHHHDDDTTLFDDGANSQIDLVEYASKN